MPTPDFTPDEQYLIDDYCRSSDGRAWWGQLVWTSYWFIPAAVLFFFGMSNDEGWATFLGFSLLVLHQVIESVRGARWGGVLRSIVEKYRACVEQLQSDALGS